jgi:putative NADH-flavin reductase
MKLIVLGATGGTGIEIVRQERFAGQIIVKQGDLLNSAALADAIRGHEAVLSGFGPRVPIAKEDTNLLRNFATALTAAMQRTGVHRVVVISTAFLFKDAIVPPAYLFGRLFFPGVVADASAMERIFEASGLDWTILRPPQLTDKTHTGKYRVREAHLPPFGFKISRADVADCFLKTAADPASIRKVLGVSH